MALFFRLVSVVGISFPVLSSGRRCSSDLIYGAGFFRAMTDLVVGLLVLIAVLVAAIIAALLFVQWYRSKPPPKPLTQQTNPWPDEEKGKARRQAEEERDASSSP